MSGGRAWEEEERLKEQVLGHPSSGEGGPARVPAPRPGDLGCEAVAVDKQEY